MTGNSNWSLDKDEGEVTWHWRLTWQIPMAIIGFVIWPVTFFINYDD